MVFRLGARFSKDPETFRACKTIFGSSVSKNEEVYMPETSCMKGTYVHSTALFNNMWTPKVKAQLTNAFFVAINQMFGGSSQAPTMLSELCSTIWFDNRSLGSSRKQGGGAEHLIDGSEKRICWLSFEFRSQHVIEKRSKKMWIKQLCKREVQDFAMVFQAQKVTGAVEKQVPEHSAFKTCIVL